MDSNGKDDILYVEMKKLLGVLLLFLILTAPLMAPVSAKAAEVSRMGIHVLSTGEVEDAKTLLNVEGEQDKWHYVTIPFTLEDLKHKKRWQEFFQQAKDQRLIPIVRLATKVDGDKWLTPNRKNVVDQLNFLSSLDWPTAQKHVIIFNEVNHAKEWGGRLDPEEYARTFIFASNWARAIDNDFVILPAAMDLAAPNSSETMEAFNYLDKMHHYDNEVFSYADAWNSHSYPNPGFAAAPSRRAKNALNGFEYELDYLKDKTDREFKVYITETGWEESSALRRWLPSYYAYAVDHVWSHPQIAAVTPFLLQGSPGPFSGFSFLNTSGEPTSQYRAFQAAIEKTYGQQVVSSD